MNWQMLSPMGGNSGGGEMGGMPGNGVNRLHATEYTLQGVMRFLQSEWHRHERDRNAWEIERQEMKARIARLEGQSRRADATQKALSKYISILEKKVKAKDGKVEGEPGQNPSSDHPNRDALIAEKLRSSKQPIHVDESGFVGQVEDEVNRAHLKSYLDRCQQEFAYLMGAPANPAPPRESPPLPLMEEFPMDRETYGIPPNQQPMEGHFQPQPRRVTNHVREIAIRQAQGANHNQQQPPMQPGPLSQKSVDVQSQAMVRSGADNQNALYGGSSDWQQAPAPSIPEQQANVGLERGSEMASPPEDTEAGGADVDNDSWEFPDPAASASAVSNASRPDTEGFPSADSMPKSPSRPGSHRRKGSMPRRRSMDHELSLASSTQKPDSGSFKLRFGLRGHLDTVRTVIFSGGGSPGEPEICTAGDDGLIKRFNVPRLDLPTGSQRQTNDLDVMANFTHRGHLGAVLCLASWSPSPNFATGGRAQGDGWIFSGGQDSTIRVWERGRVDPKATIDSHTDAVWALCVLPATLGSMFGQTSPHGTPDRILLVSGAADGTVKLWAISAPPQLSSPQPGSNRRGTGSSGRVRGNSMSSGSGFSSAPQPNMATSSPFHYTQIHSISRTDGSTASPTCITPLSPTGESFVVSYSDAAILVYDTRTAEQIGSLASLETYDGTVNTSVNAVVATTVGLDQTHHVGVEEDLAAGGPTGGGRSMAGSGVEGVIISGHEDRFVRFFDANSGQCTYSMWAHPSAISSLSLSPDGRELVSSGHDASLRFWSLEKRSCTQEVTSHRIMRGEGICSVVWSQDGRWVVSGGGDGVVKVFAR